MGFGPEASLGFGDELGGGMMLVARCGFTTHHAGANVEATAYSLYMNDNENITLVCGVAPRGEFVGPISTIQQPVSPILASLLFPPVVASVAASRTRLLESDNTLRDIYRGIHCFLEDVEPLHDLSFDTHIAYAHAPSALGKMKAELIEQVYIYAGLNGFAVSRGREAEILGKYNLLTPFIDRVLLNAPDIYE